jgi:hypothetical protein
MRQRLRSKGAMVARRSPVTVRPFDLTLMPYEVGAWVRHAHGERSPRAQQRLHIRFAATGIFGVEPTVKRVPQSFDILQFFRNLADMGDLNPLAKAGA